MIFMRGQETYPPTGSWKCPDCNKKHSKPHFAFPDQVDTNKQVSEEGRVKYEREGKSGCFDGETGPDFEIDECNRIVMKGLFCPHCGFVHDITNIIKKC
jgi:hypothetical protein